ncbi:hypothetical protein IAU60_001359 [Kwoniella sp. DSM 27419]
MDPDGSMEEGDSLFSLPGPSQRTLYHTPPHAIRPGPPVNSAPATRHSHGHPQMYSEIDDSFEEANRWTGASPVAEDASYEYGTEQAGDNDDDDDDEGLTGAEGDEGEVEGEEEEYAESEGSSAQYDPDADPEGFAQRLDELAGVLEMGEEEARALRWGPAIGRERDAPALSMDALKRLVNHHLTATDWRFSPSHTILPPLTGRSTALLPLANMDVDMADVHPIRVLGRAWVEADADLAFDDESDLGGSSPVHSTTVRRGSGVV